MSLAYLTAIARNRMSAPAQFLSSHCLLNGQVLDYGCGRGKDCEELECDGYDPHYRPEFPKKQYDTIMCNFVLNVIENENERQAVLGKIDSLLKPGGKAYISVRNDRRKLNGKTSKGTFQTFVELPLPVVSSSSSYLMYEYNRENKNG